MAELVCPFCNCPVEVNEYNEITFCLGCELGIGSYAISIDEGEVQL